MRKITKKTVAEGHCEGSWKVRSTTRGRRLTQGGPKYPCPICHKYVGCDSVGNFNKHGWKQVPVAKSQRAKKGVVSFCAECGDMIDGIDYLCSDCRD